MRTKWTGNVSAPVQSSASWPLAAGTVFRLKPEATRSPWNGTWLPRSGGRSTPNGSSICISAIFRQLAATRDAEGARDQTIAHRVRHPRAENRAQPRVAADEIARARRRRGQRVLHRAGDHVGIDAATPRLLRHLAPLLRARAVAPPGLVGQRRVLRLRRLAGLVPDRRRDASRLDERDANVPRLQLDAQRVRHRLER